MTPPTPRAFSPIPLTELLDATGGEPVGNLPRATTFRWIERNSRVVVPGDLFIAVKGEAHDGHSFVVDAIARGATAALVSRAWAAGRTDSSLPLVVVDSPVTALQRLAAARRRLLPAQVIGVTGSIGKTSTKEAIAGVLSQQFKTYRSPGNMNSEIGLPLSLLEIDSSTEFAVLEMGGAYAPGEVALLAEIARPLIGVVTNIHPVHLERMGTIEAIADTKAELVEALPAGGFAILNGDDLRVRGLATRTAARTIMYGLGDQNDIRASDVTTRGVEGISFVLHTVDEHIPLNLPLLGVHSVELALAAIATGLALEMKLDRVISGLMNRSVQVRLLSLPGPNGSRLIDDTYNASAPSVLSALGLLAESPAKRRIAVLGDMRELGIESPGQHQIVGECAAGIADWIVTYGGLARQIADTAVAAAEVDGRRVNVQSFDADQREELIGLLLSDLKDGDLVLLKGSRGLEMERIVHALHDVAEVANSQE